jgi:hypothetical protein
MRQRALIGMRRELAQKLGKAATLIRARAVAEIHRHAPAQHIRCRLCR